MDDLALAAERVEHALWGDDLPDAGLWVMAIAAIVTFLYYVVLTAPDSSFCHLAPPAWEAWYECRLPWQW